MNVVILVMGLTGCGPDKGAGETGRTGGDSAAEPDSSPAEEAETAGETAETAETAETGAASGALPVDTGTPGGLIDPWDPLSGLCQLALTCDHPVLSEDKTACTLSVTDAEGAVWYEGAAVAWLRGRSSYSVPKHSYGVELHDEAGEDAEVDLLGMGSESDWVLNGLYYDRLLVRNRVGFDLFQTFGGDERYAPQSALCELTLDGAYVGAYALTERIKRDGSRVELEPDDGAGGSFVMKQNDEGCFYYNTTTYGCWKLIYPNEDTISEASAQGITDFMTAMEAAVTSADPYDEETGVFAYVDMDSLVDIVILEELFKNEDCWYTSMHIFKDQGGKIHFIPWDLDMTFGQFPDYYDYGDPEQWIKYRPEWVTVMAESPEFKARLAARWAELREGELADEAIYARIDAAQAVLGEAIDRNFELWPITSINYAGLFFPVSSYADEDAYVRAWIAERTAFMDANIDSF